MVWFHVCTTHCSQSFMRKCNVHSTHIKNIRFGVRLGSLFFLHPNSLAVILNIGCTSNQWSKIKEVGTEFFESILVNLEEEEYLPLLG